MKYAIIFILTSILYSGALSQESISLITPYDKDTINTKNPLLGWFYMNASDFSRISYRIIIVELKKEQSAEAGILINVPLLKMKNLKSSQLFYPYDAPELIEGHRYGWQIQKIENNIIIDKSEAWEFILALPKVPKFKKYVTLKTKGDGMLYEAVGGKIFFKMDEKYYSEKLNYYILNEKLESVYSSIIDDEKSSKTEGELEVKKNGSNFYELDLGNSVKAGNYTLIVVNAKAEEYKLNFFVK
ncbi:MAG: hypothetical protein COA33_012485 [Fluviicola sp.]|nr:hypothetical protein [Fluviicola sp.]